MPDSNNPLRLMWTYRIGPRRAWRLKRILDVVDRHAAEVRRHADRGAS